MQNRRAGVAGVVTRRRESEIAALGRSLPGRKNHHGSDAEHSDVYIYDFFVFCFSRDG